MFTFLFKKLGIARIKIVTDSKYVKDGMESWIVNWMENGWKTANGSQVANKKMWEELLVLVKEINIKWVSVIRKHIKVFKVISCLYVNNLGVG
jgi:ribonuclease HI